MLVAGTTTTTTLGYAVAGRFVTDVTPIGVCAIDPVAPTTKKYTGTNELVELGYRRGVTYNIFSLNPLGGAVSDPYLVNPVDVPPSCNPSHSSAAFTGPFVCSGSSAVVAGSAISVNTNTGYSTGPIQAALNSRFDVFGGPSPCDPASAPPDSNVKEYHCSPNGNADCLNPVASQQPQLWMQPGSTALPNQEPVDIVAHKPFYNVPPAAAPNPGGTSFSKYGVLWSYGPAYPGDASVPPQAQTTPFTISQAKTLGLYDSNTALDIFDAANYPTTLGTGFPAGTPPAPYNQTSGTYFQAPPTHPPGQRNRRVLNLVIVDCRNPPVGPASCGVMPVVGVGKFFMQTPAVFTGGPANRRLMVEFAGLVEPVPTAEIKLYR